MDRTLYISDLDGTLLDPSSRISSETASILNPLIDKGLMFTVATARTPATVEELLRPLHPSRTPAGLDIPAIVMTGAAYWDLRNHEFVYLQTMSDETSAKILRTFEREGVNPFIYCCGGKDRIDVYHPTEMTDRENDFYQERRHLKIKKFHIGTRPAVVGSVILFFAIGTPEKMERICREIKRETGYSAAWYRDIFNPSVALMDVYVEGVSKAEAVKDIAAQLDCNRTVVFGDNLNDLPMMRVADVAVAVENALPEVKEEADVVIGPNTAPSVAEFIARDFAGRNR